MGPPGPTPRRGAGRAARLGQTQRVLAAWGPSRRKSGAGGKGAALRHRQGGFSVFTTRRKVTVEHVVSQSGGGRDNDENCGQPHAPEYAGAITFAPGTTLPSADEAREAMRGNPDQMCGDALGRFVLVHRLGREVYDLGQRYGLLVRRFYASRGIPAVFPGSRRFGARGFQRWRLKRSPIACARSTARWSRSRARDCPPCELFMFSSNEIGAGCRGRWPRGFGCPPKF